MSDRIPVTIWGATGFAGAELLRIFARHPHFEVIGAVSRSKAGTSVGAAHPHLRHVYNEMTFISPEEAAQLARSEYQTQIAAVLAAGWLTGEQAKENPA